MYKYNKEHQLIERLQNKSSDSAGYLVLYTYLLTGNQVPTGHLHLDQR